MADDDEFLMDSDTSHEDEEEEEHVMHPKEDEDDIEDSDSDFDPIGFGIEERIRQVKGPRIFYQSLVFFKKAYIFGGESVFCFM